jgi:hypothetical protein
VPNIAPPSASGNTNASGGGGANSPASRAKHGRRARAEHDEDAPRAKGGWGESAAAAKDDRPVASFQQIGDAPEAPSTSASAATASTTGGTTAQRINAAQIEEDLRREVAAAPSEYHTAMPRASELEQTAAARWAALQHGVAGGGAGADGIDLAPLMSALTLQLDDDDVAWDPEQLLMQLASELNDRVAAAAAYEESKATAGTGAGGVGADGMNMGGGASPAPGGAAATPVKGGAAGVAAMQPSLVAAASVAGGSTPSPVLQTAADGAAAGGPIAGRRRRADVEL